MSDTKNGAERAVEMCDTLVRDGWREYPNAFKRYARCFYRRFDTPTRCRGNSDKAGIQVQCAVSSHNEHTGYELEISAGLPDETWIRLHNYCLPDDINDGLRLIPRMIRAWEFIANDQAELTYDITECQDID